MTAFQIVILVLTALGLSGGILAVYIRTQIEVAKIQVQIKYIEKDLTSKELAICNLEKKNGEEHKSIIDKLDTLNEKIK